MKKMMKLKEREIGEVGAPPPSPIPTGRGSRSAANETLNRYLQQASSLNIPDLSLPTVIPDIIISYSSLEDSNPVALHQLLMCARDHGAFRIRCDGIDGDHELRSFIHEARHLFLPDHDDHVSWVRRGKEECRIDSDARLRLSDMMENVSSKLDAIAELVLKIIAQHNSLSKRNHTTNESVLTLYRYKYLSKILGQDDDGYTLCLHLPTTQSRFLVKSCRGTLAFDTAPDTILVTLGKLLEEWSMGQLKSVAGEVTCTCEPYHPKHSFSIHLKYFSFNLGFTKSISVKDQIALLLILLFLCPFLSSFPNSLF